ncbi:MAG: FAD-binding oxidoreductase [Alkalispirochaeta sp.]
MDHSGLTEIFGDNMLVDTKKIQRYGVDQVGDDHYRQAPAAVVFPTATTQVAALMKWANRTGVSVTPRGAGSGLAGAAIAAAGGVICSFEKMNRIIDIDTENLMVTVEPGVVTNALDAELKAHGLFFAGYPMSEDICFIGGNVAENAGGGRAVKYGTTATYVLGAEVVTPTGEILHLGGKRLKDVTGYNLLQLIVGSEGTLGLFTQLVIRVIPRPSVRGVLLAAFSNVPEATKCIAALKRESSEIPSAIEFIDGETARRTNDSMKSADRQSLNFETQAYLLIEFDGAQIAVVEALLQGAADLVTEHGGTPDTMGTQAEMMEAAWKLRKQVPWWVKRNAGSYHSLEDVVVPPAAVPRLVMFVDRLRSSYQLPIAVFGHAGDGNFHVTPMKAQEMSPERWMETVPQVLGELYREVVHLGGTISGEHGIGRKRVKNLHVALSDAERASMIAIKRALDPKNVLNPGVIFAISDVIRE